MCLDERHRDLVHAFREQIERQLADEPGFGPVSRHDIPDRPRLITRWLADKRVWYELAVRPTLPQVRVGMLTDARWRRQDFERMVADSGDTLRELIEAAFAAAGITWHEPPVEHYREHERLFYFATPVDLESLDDLAAEALPDRICRMLKGYHLAFTGRVP
jgi:hypothetical protein